LNPQYDKREVVNFSVLVGLGVLLFFIFVAAYFFYGLQPADGETFAKSFVIERGEGFKDIGARLSQESLIKSIAVFKMYALITGRAQNIQPGTYELSNAMTVPQIVDTITSAKRNDVLITIPEGSTLRDIETMLVQNGVLQKKGDLADFPIASLKIDYPFLARAESLEGFLFPETYYFEKNSSPESAIRIMLNVFARRAWPLLSESKDWYETLILASYLEREVPEFENRQRVAGVLLKRIRIGMPLQVDATISYAKCGGETRGCPNIKVLRTDVDYSSPYNTYRRTGFTPTPIANPGEAALRAALSPLASPYLYYLSSPETQETFFSRTLQEHNEKRKKYLSI
jgi:UPF0755 protein